MSDNLNAKIKQLEKLINEKYVKAIVFHLLKETNYAINCWKKTVASTKIRNLIIESRIITTGALGKALFRRKCYEIAMEKSSSTLYIYIYIYINIYIYIYIICIIYIYIYIYI